MNPPNTAFAARFRNLSWLDVAAEDEVRVAAQFTRAETLGERVHRFDHRGADVPGCRHIQRMDHAEASEVTTNDDAGAVSGKRDDVPRELVEPAVATEQILLDVGQVKRRNHEVVCAGVLTNGLD